MSRFHSIIVLLAGVLTLAACMREPLPAPSDLPDGTPITIRIPFGSEDYPDVTVGTKAEASYADESRVHDLYVLIFDAGGNKFYGRYFTHEHRSADLKTLDVGINEGWYVENAQSSIEKTRGVVKVSTESKSGTCTLVVVANLASSVTNLDGMSTINRLANIRTLDELKAVQVHLAQDVTNRHDLFLMLGQEEVPRISELVWGKYEDSAQTIPVYYENDKTDDDPDNWKISRLTLERVSAKVKFRIKVNPTNVESFEPRRWRVYNVPSSCYLYPTADDPSGDDIYYFDTEEAYYEGTEVEGTDTYQVFTFYVLENRQTAGKIAEGKETAVSYIDRDKQEKLPTTAGAGDPVTNGGWVCAPDNAIYVRFSGVLTLTPAGIEAIVGASGGTAITTEALYTVHLGDFAEDMDNFDTERNHAYTYNVTVQNAKSIYTEVTDWSPEGEKEPGHEGSLLLTSDEVVQCDAHYEYHSISFGFSEGLDRNAVSWNVKTPFWEGAARWDSVNNKWDIVPAENPDYNWVLFAVNEIDGEQYSEDRVPFPGESEYKPEWAPGLGERPKLMDIHQLVQYIFAQTDSVKSHKPNDFKSETIRVTAFVNEFYYEKDPRTGEVNPDLWREFVNADPRELHILSDARVSRDGQSQFVNSSHSIIQKSIQSIYNTHSPLVSSVWGTEHTDEMRNRGEIEAGATVHAGWKWNNGSVMTTDNKYCGDIENGRYNTAGLWGINPAPATPKQWATYLEYNVGNTVPELRSADQGGTSYQYMVYSCMTRNRDNNGNGNIDPDEIRWYLASLNQLTGLWVGNEALSQTARVYQPLDANSPDPFLWRAHVVSSTCRKNNNRGTDPRVLVAEEGASIYDYTSRFDKAFPGNDRTETTFNKVQSVRCLRNAGTYNEGGRTVDISHAPLDKVVDPYYEAPAGLDSDGRLRPNDDGTYTVRFSSLNTKAIREYTAEDLPFHDEFSMHNRVYLELNMQDPTVHATPDASMTENLQVVNETITRDGHNKYCPAGYRLPNMTELSVMAALLPPENGYWTGVTDAPSRTFFTKGELGKKYSTEQDKVGWAFSPANGNIHLIKNDALKGLRCVRDDNMTGNISGKLTLSKSRVHAGDPTVINLNFTSTGSALKDIALALCYENASGNQQELSIPTGDIELNGTVLEGSLDYTTPADLPVRGQMSLRVTLRNAAGQTASFYAPIEIISNVSASIQLLPYAYEGNFQPRFPVLVSAKTDGGSLSGWKLRVTSPDEISHVYIIPAKSGRDWTTAYFYDFESDENLQVGEYTFQLEAADEEGVVTRSETVSMEIIRQHFQPNVEDPANPWKTAADITGRWEPQRLSDLDFGAGDFLETMMDISRCVFKTASVGPTGNNYNLGMDELFGLGLSENIGWVNNTLHFYYPAVNNNVSSLHLDYVYGSAYQGLSIFELGREAPSLFRMDQEGVFWNGQMINMSQFNSSSNSVLSKLLSSNVLYIGSIEGLHRSRALYHFVRVVRNRTSTMVGTIDGGSGFGGNPIPGGNL